jgi:hypothetical protein
MVTTAAEARALLFTAILDGLPENEIIALVERTTLGAVPERIIAAARSTVSRLAINMIAARVHRANHKWWVDINTGEPLKRNVGELLMLVTSELAEALEGDRKTMQDDKLPARRMFDVEIIDAFIRLFDIAGSPIVDADPGAIFEEKMAFNAVRADHQHEHRLKDGGKKY